MPGPSRIPTFGTRIPQFGSASKPKQPDVERAISSADLGKTVVTVGKVGILRFVGKVHFASGVWCGIELETDAGKNDGCIDGIRYFTCSRGRGLMTPLSKVSFYNPREKQGISHSRSSDSVKSSEFKGVIFENKQDFVYKKDAIVENKGCEQKFYNTRPNLPQILNRERTFEKIEREGNRLSKNVLLYDKNDNKSSNEKIYLKNNNTKKEVFIPDSNGIHNFRTQPEHKALENPIPACSTSENGNSLLLVETFSKSGTPKIETCKELYEKKFASQITEESGNKPNKTKENVELTNTEIITKKPTQIVDFKDRITAETSFTRNISSCLEVKEQSSESHNFRTFIYSQEEENKRDSLDLDESLEILSTSQMNDGFSVVESIFTLDDMPGQKSSCHSPLPSSNFDLILHENAALLNDTTLNLDLPLDTIDKSKTFGFARLEETPSPEELPLDPIPIVEPEPKTVTSKSKIESKTNSFITSITSITSLDTGYQGDGEMSRPGSRGADNSPLTRRPLQRPAPRRTDAMTDSDFFTESDADNHDENVLKGDRKAQVIDGTLYGVDPQAAADIYVNNRENMDSSGVFTDLESNTRAEELLVDEKIDISPSDTSSKTLSENSQNNLHEIIAKNLANNESKKKDSQIESAKKRGSSSPVISNTSSTTSPLHIQREDSNKKYKTLKREVQSKVKMLLETNVSKSEKKILKKPAGRWDAVMNKISKSDSKTNFQEVKSRVFNGANTTPNSPIDAKKLNSSRLVNGQKSPNNKLRRVRTRVLNSPNCSKNNNFESINSSLSDLSASTPKKPIAVLFGNRPTSSILIEICLFTIDLLVSELNTSRLHLEGLNFRLCSFEKKKYYLGLHLYELKTLQLL
ncbi:hypothetical protein WA026_008372 [Henosepilachna vigintioctopunctata]|uniref:CAP-Gly domain-containing protein n=1 Tax=Henosepilachna vigintioctopunctata TaxID=420089 RepID=A0AAW1UKD9_9CUCU